MNYSQHVLIIGTVWPEPNSSAAGSRMMQLIQLFLGEGWKITFASAAADSDFMFDVTSLGIDKVTIELNNESFDVFIKEVKPTIVLFDRFMTEEQFGWRVAEHCPDALRIIDTEDLHCLRIARQQAFKESRTVTANDLRSDIAKREIASILRSDLSLIISDVEMELLRSYFKVDPILLHYVPFMLDPIGSEVSSQWPLFEERDHFVTIGNFLHEPNWNAVLYLKQEIWPLIKKELPEAELHIYGAYPSQKVFELHQPKDGFHIKGRAQNAHEVMRNAKVCLAPLRFGAGLKGKLVEAMQCATPSVTTDIGAEGMHGSLEWNGVIANDAERIATAAVQLFTDKKSWIKCQQNGVKIINQFYSKEKLGKPLLERISALQQNISEHRSNNFIGSTLMYHTLNSTKYMSRWIEAKNKLLKD